AEDVGGPDHSGGQPEGVAGAASDVEHPLARLESGFLEHGFVRCRVAGDEAVDLAHQPRPPGPVGRHGLNGTGVEGDDDAWERRHFSGAPRRDGTGAPRRTPPPPPRRWWPTRRCRRTRRPEGRPPPRPLPGRLRPPSSPAPGGRGGRRWPVAPPAGRTPTGSRP